MPDAAAIAEIAYYHLVLSESDPAQAKANVRDLIGRLTTFAGESLVTEPAGWIACCGCGCWVGTELVGPDGAGEAENGGFYCSECRFARET